MNIFDEVVRHKLIICRKSIISSMNAFRFLTEEMMDHGIVITGKGLSTYIRENLMALNTSRKTPLHMVILVPHQVIVSLKETFPSVNIKTQTLVRPDSENTCPGSAFMQGHVIASTPTIQWELYQYIQLSHEGLILDHHYLAWNYKYPHIHMGKLNISQMMLDELMQEDFI